MDIPGGMDFRDVTHIFNDAAKDLEIDEILMTEGFTLSEAMSAVEIGDPRMDNGAELPNSEKIKTFDPLLPLLPQEVCWILDRSMACEMQWHTGNGLAQTVYTSLYMHHLSEINPSFIPSDTAAIFSNPSKPIQLIVLVLRAGIMGMVKSCDLVYRELVKGNVHECEDWQSEKSEVSLLEMVLPERVVALLEEAELWLMDDAVSAMPFRNELLLRIRFRKILLLLFSLDLPQKAPYLVTLLAQARKLHETLSQSPPIVIDDNSPARLAFDPQMMRTLNLIMPMHALTLLSQKETWELIEGILDGFELLYGLSGCESLLAWNTVGFVRSSNPKWTSSRLPYSRSLVQTAFSNGTVVMGRFSLTWPTERFFLEAAHISYPHLASLFESRPFSFVSDSFDTFTNTLTRLLLRHVWASYYNRPRQRRHHMKAALEWHILFESALSLAEKATPRDALDAQILTCLPYPLLHWRACILKDIILSGFELELYMHDERPFAYWYLAQISQVHIIVIGDLMEHVPEDTPAHRYLSHQKLYAEVIYNMAMGSFILLAHSSKLDARRRWTNFTVRYKWALRKDFAECSVFDMFCPDFQAYLRNEKNVLKDSNSYEEAKLLFDGALRLLIELGLSSEQDPSLLLCRAEFTQDYLGGIVVVCESLKQFTYDLGEQVPSDAMFRQAHESLKWDPKTCPWFPTTKSES